MNFVETTLKGAYVITLQPMTDERGGFVRTFCKNEFGQIGHTGEFVQMNHSFNTKKGTVRGMHYQAPPFAEVKLIRCIKGAVYDVIVDLRRTSPTFMQWFGVQLSAANLDMIYVPQGFAHGFQTLEDDTQLLYHHTEFYAPAAEKGICYNDSAIGIQWPEAVSNISAKDKSYPPVTTDFKGIEL